MTDTQLVVAKAQEICGLPSRNYTHTELKVILFTPVLLTTVLENFIFINKKFMTENQDTNSGFLVDQKHGD